MGQWGSHSKEPVPGEANVVPFWVCCGCLVRDQKLSSATPTNSDHKPESGSLWGPIIIIASDCLWLGAYLNHNLLLRNELHWSLQVDYTGSACLLQADSFNPRLCKFLTLGLGEFLV